MLLFINGVLCLEVQVFLILIEYFFEEKKNLDIMMKKNLIIDVDVDVMFEEVKFVLFIQLNLMELIIFLESKKNFLKVF